MFKKKCKNCSEKIKSNHKFCEFCGFPQKNKKSSQKDWGMLGKKDTEENLTKDLFGGIGGGMLNKMIGSAMKMIEKEMQKEMSKENVQNSEPKARSNIRLMINGKEIAFNNEQKKPQPEVPKERLKSAFSKKNTEKFSKLEKKEPKTNMKRFSDKIVYEIEVPKVKSVEDVSVINFENSIEVKAIAKDKAYRKLIPVGLPVKNYRLEKGKLVLELQGN